MRVAHRARPSCAASGCAIAPTFATGSREERSRECAHGVLLRIVGQVLDRRLAVDAREHEPGQQRGGARLAARRRLPRDVRQIRGRQRSEGVDIARAPLRLPRAFEQQVIQHEREIERRVAVPRALGVEDHRARRADQQILRAEVAVDQHALRGSRGLDERIEREARDRDARAPSHRDTARDEARGRAHPSGSARRCRADPPWRRESGRARRRLPRPSADSTMPVRSRSFQTGCVSGGRYAIAKHPLARSSPRIAGTAPGTIVAGDAHPLHLRAIALDRHAPIGGDLELGQRALDADGPAGQIDPKDLGRHAARQGDERELIVSAYYRHVAPAHALVPHRTAVHAVIRGQMRRLRISLRENGL